jgi:hypothetical protein
MGFIYPDPTSDKITIRLKALSSDYFSIHPVHQLLKIHAFYEGNRVNICFFLS